MADETHEPRGSSEDRGPPLRIPVVFLSAITDASGMIEALRAAGYVVVDLPIAELVERSRVERPNVVVLDVDAEAVLEEVARVRRLPGTGAIDFIYIGSGTGTIRSTDDAIAREGSAFFQRPLDVDALLRRIEALTGGTAARSRPRHSRPPSPAPRLSSIPPDRLGPSLPAPGLRTPGPPLPMSVPSLADLVDPPRSLASFGTVSNELQQLLTEAEMRAESMAQPEREAPLPSPEEEIESVLPADVLASLDEPLEGDEDEEQEPRIATGAGQDRDGTSSHGKPTTAGGSKHTTSSGSRSSSTPQTYERRTGVGSDNPPRETTPFRRQTDEWQPSSSIPVASIPTVEPRAEPGGQSLPVVYRQAIRSDLPLRPHLARAENVTSPPIDMLPPSQSAERGLSEVPPQEPTLGAVVLRPVDARRFLADAIARRLSGAICFEHDRVVRRLVLRDGDLVTAASGSEQESLVSFLGARGDLPRDEVERLAGKIPPYGRHAGAALVAHGWLGQDQLWTVLRAHAEWVATLVLRLGGGTAQLEAEPPGRLRSEPSVFGASTGPEIFVELVRRAVSTEEAIEVLGGEGSRIDDGPARALLAECVLPPAELELLSRARGGTLGDLLSRSPDGEIAAVVHGLALLGVLDVIPAVQPIQAQALSLADAEAALLDEEAIRARIRARLELVDEGDYFSLLGVSREATSYEVRRAFVELRRAFEPSRILSPRLLDLEPDVRKIVVVLEEAYEILRDGARRERYRRAIEARPA